MSVQAEENDKLLVFYSLQVLTNKKWPVKLHLLKTAEECLKPLALTQDTWSTINLQIAQFMLAMHRTAATSTKEKLSKKTKSWQVYRVHYMCHGETSNTKRKVKGETYNYLLVWGNKFKSFLDNTAAIHLQCQWQDMTSNPFCQSQLLFKAAKLDITFGWTSLLR